MQLSGILVIILGRHNFEGMAVEFRCTAALITHILLLEISTFLTDLKAKIIIYHMQEIIKIARKQYKILCPWVGKKKTKLQSLFLQLTKLVSNKTASVIAY